MLAHTHSLESDVWKYTTMLRPIPVPLDWTKLISQISQAHVQDYQTDYNKSFQFPTAPDGPGPTPDSVYIR